MFDLPEKDLPRLLGEVRGLILGPTLTLHPGVTAELAASLGVSRQPPITTFHQSLFESAASGTTPDDLRAKVEAFIDAIPAGPLLPDLARVSWKAVLSATPDLRFENLFKQEMDRKPHRNPVAVIDDLARPVPPRKVPVFKLVGSVSRAELLLTRTQFYQRKAQWRASVRSFIEQTRGAPLLCLGMDESIDVLQELFSEMIAAPHLRPSIIALFGDDPLAGNTHIADLVDSFSKLCVIQASTSTLPKAFSASAKATGASVSGETQTQFLNLGALSHLVSVVNQQLVPSSSRTERHRLLDLLFSPAVANWEPFAHNFDFPRSAAEVLADLNAVLNTNPFSTCAAVITGGAASGKTVLLKRLAFDLAKKGRQVLWLRPALYPDSDQVLIEVFKAVNRILKNQRVVVVMDDPPSFMSLTPREVVRAARVASLDILLLVAARTSEWSVRDTRDFVGPVDVKVHAELPDSLDEAEWLTLPDYLVKLNIYTNRSFAETALRAIQQRSAGRTPLRRINVRRWSGTAEASAAPGVPATQWSGQRTCG